MEANKEQEQYIVVYDWIRKLKIDEKKLTRLQVDVFATVYGFTK